MDRIYLETNHELIQAHLEKVLAHPTFLRAPKISNLLTYLVREELAGDGEKLTGYKVGVEGLNKAEDFDPSADAGVRVETGRLRRMLQAYYVEDVLGNLRIEVPKGSYRPRFIKVEAAPDASLESVIAPSSGPAVAILAFDTHGGRDDEQLVAIGLRVEVLDELYRYKEFHFLDASGVNASDAGVHQRCRDEFECEFMLKTLIQCEDKLAHIHISVTDLQLNRIIWSKKYPLALAEGDVLAASADIAAEIAQSLVKPAGILPIAAVRKRLGKPPADWTASDCILRWHLYRLRDRTRKNHAAVRGQIRELLNRDPGFAYGYVMYAMLRIDEIVYRMNPEESAEETFRRAEFLVNQAISADPDNALAHYVKAQCHYFKGEKTQFLTSVEEALALNPRNADLLHHIGVFLLFAGETERGTALMDAAGMRYNTGIGYRLGYILREYFLGESADEGIRLFDSTYLPPDLSVGYMAGGLIHCRAGNKEKATELMVRAYTIEQTLGRELTNLSDLWFLDPSLRTMVGEELALLGNLANNVVRLPTT